MMSAAPNQEQILIAREHLPAILYATQEPSFLNTLLPKFPIIHEGKKKQGLSVLGTLAGIAVTLGNAVANAGMAFFQISAVLAGGFAVISGAGTLFAFSSLYGKSVIPAVQRLVAIGDKDGG